VSRTPLLVALLAACSFPPPPDIDPPNGPGVPDDAQNDAPADSAPIDAPPDAPDVPGTVLQVSPTGDDANDGLALPVKTLKHAIGLAAANPQLTKITLAAGRYSTATGETFPYTIPANLALVGPAGGGAILVGSKAEPGLSIGAATLQDIEFEDFTTAITATGTSIVRNVRIRTTSAPMVVESAAKLTLDNVDITGVLGGCTTGIVLNGAADLTASSLATRSLGTTLEAKDQSTINIRGASISGDRNCQSQAFNRAVISLKTNKSFVLSDGVIDGGVNGVLIETTSSDVTIVRSTIRNMKFSAINGGESIVRVTDSELSSNGDGGISAGRGNYSLTNVTMRNNGIWGIFFWGDPSPQRGTLTMRGCTISGPADGLSLWNFAVVDLGTSGSPGNNTFQATSGVALFMDSAIGPAVVVNAVGNTWRPVQGANASGRYSNVTVQTTADRLSGNNYAITAPWRLNL